MPRQRSLSSKDTAIVLVAFLGLFGTLASEYFGYLGNIEPVKEVIKATQTAEANLRVPFSTETLTPQIKISDPTSTPLFAPEINQRGASMIFVPAGTFMMGETAENAFKECQEHRSDCEQNWFTDEMAPHLVEVEAFYMDKYEVSNRQYQECVESGTCQPPLALKSFTQPSYYGNPQYENYPVIYVNWSMAKTYCEWRQARLPTEAEWEYAARGTDGRLYPWGNDFAGAINSNFCDLNCRLKIAEKAYDDGYVDTAPVDSYSAGASPFGIYNMAGNVWEWTSSLYRPYPFDPDDGREDASDGGKRAIRGGSCCSPDNLIRSANRNQYAKNEGYYYLGIRCAKNPSQ